MHLLIMEKSETYSYKPKRFDFINIKLLDVYQTPWFYGQSPGKDTLVRPIILKGEGLSWIISEEGYLVRPKILKDEGLGSKILQTDICTELPLEGNMFEQKFKE